MSPRTRSVRERSGVRGFGVDLATFVRDAEGCVRLGPLSVTIKTKKMNNEVVERGSESEEVSALGSKIHFSARRVHVYRSS